jgi:hypothetical protein
MPVGDDRQPLGAIFDTNSDGRFDLVVYDDGLLAVRGTYIGVALRGAGAGGVGAGGAVGAGVGSGLGSSGAKSYENKRLEKLLQRPRGDIIDDPVSFFVEKEEVTDIILRKRWHGCSLTVCTRADPRGRKFSWKPALNNFAAVENLLKDVFAERVRRV